MAYLTHARDLRNLLSVAAKLRRLSTDTLYKGDQLLYLTAAKALEKRADWLSGALTYSHVDRDLSESPYLHKSVDLVI